MSRGPRRSTARAGGDDGATSVFPGADDGSGRTSVYPGAQGGGSYGDVYGSPGNQLAASPASSRSPMVRWVLAVVILAVMVGAAAFLLLMR